MVLSKYQINTVTDAHMIENKEARLLFEKAYAEHVNGDIEMAIQLYQKSIEVSPSAPAYTYLAWAESSLSNFGKAITLCEKAIKIDPDYGNPYNDIGVYLMALGRDDESIEWFEKAIDAPKYNCKFFPFYNLGKIYAAESMIKKAILCFEMSLTYDPEFEDAKTAYEDLKLALN